MFITFLLVGVDAGNFDFATGGFNDFGFFIVGKRAVKFLEVTFDRADDQMLDGKTDARMAGVDFVDFGMRR